MRKLLATVSLMVVAFFMVIPAAAHYHQSSGLTKSQKKAQKDWQKYSRQQEKAQKKQLKAQNKAAKKYNKEHGTRTTVR